MKLSFCSIAFLALLAPTARAQYEPKTCWAHPDPHFKTWEGDYYDYQGGCEIVMVHNSVIDLHIRTDVRGFYSAVINAALRINGQVLEVNETDYMINGVVPAVVPAFIGGRPFTATFGGGGGGADLFEVKLEPDMGNYYVRITRYSYGSLAVSVVAHRTGFEDSEGMCGHWNTSGLFLRDNSIANNGTQMGENWQVLTTEPDLFVDNDNFAQGDCDPPCQFSWNGDDRDIGDFDGGDARALQTDSPTDHPTDGGSGETGGCFGNQFPPNGQGGEHLRRRAQDCGCGGLGIPQEAIDNCLYDALTTGTCDFNAYYDGSIPELNTFYVPADVLAPNPCAHLSCGAGGDPVLNCDENMNRCEAPDSGAAPAPTKGKKKSGKKAKSKKSKKGKKSKKSKKHTEMPTEDPPMIIPGCSCAFPLA